MFENRQVVENLLDLKPSLSAVAATYSSAIKGGYRMNYVISFVFEGDSEVCCPGVQQRSWKSH